MQVQAEGGNPTNSLRIGTNDGISNSVVQADGVVIINKWIHVVGTRGIDGNGTLYVDGQEVASGSLLIPMVTTRDFVIGGHSLPLADRYFNGLIDDVRIYNRALSTSEIQSLYVEGLGNDTDILTFTLPEETGPATVDAINHTVDIEVTYSTDVTTLTPTITLSAGATVSPLSGVVQDFTIPETYTVTAEDGITIQDWTVTVNEALNTATDILSFNFVEQTGAATIDATNHAVDIEVAPDSDLINLIATFTLSIGATAKVVSSDQVSGTTANDFTNPVTYTVTAEDGVTTQDWLITVTIAPNSETDILSFSFPEQTGPANIDNAAFNISVEVLNSTDLTSLVASFTLSPGARAEVNTIIQVSDTTSNDFTNPVTYTITAEDGITSQDWMVTVTVAQNTETDITAFSFTEQTGPATIDAVSHTVNIEVAYGTDVTNLVATFTLSTGATAKVGSTDQVSGTTPNDFTNPVTYIITAEDGVTSQDWVVSVTVAPDTQPPVITSTELPTEFPSEAESIRAVINILDNSESVFATFYYKSPLDASFGNEIGVGPDALEDYVVDIQRTWIGLEGLEYFFIAGDGTNSVSTDTVLIVLVYDANNSPFLPGLSSGGQPENWRMFSIPFILNNNTVATMFESKLGTYDKSKWRIVHYKNDEDKFIEYRQGLSVVERGKGYWLNSVQPANIPMGPGKAAAATKDNLSTIVLQKGWSQIGNPYTFDISWPDVLTFNSASGIGGLRVYEGGTSLVDANILKAYGGAYVFAGEDATLQIPLEDKTPTITKKHNEEGEWMLNFTAESGHFRNLISGLGMQNEASISKDRFDKIRVPRYNKYIDITFEHEEYYAPNFAMDIIPVSDQYTWNFHIGTNVNNTRTNLSWNIPQIDNGMRLMLYDKVNNILLDMLEETEYRFESSVVKGFKVIYGDDSYISDEMDKQNVLLGKNFPNPFNDKTTIPFTILNNDYSYQVKLTVYALDGVEINVLTNEKLSHGTYAIEWDKTDHAGNPVSPGIYIYQLEVTSKEERLAISEKMILK